MQDPLRPSDRRELRALDLRGCSNAVLLNPKQTEELENLRIVLAPYGFSMHPDGMEGCQLRWFSGQWASSSVPCRSMLSLGMLELAPVGLQSIPLCSATDLLTETVMFTEQRTTVEACRSSIPILKPSGHEAH